MTLSSYAAGEWREGTGEGVSVYHAINGEPVCQVSSQGLDFAEMARYGREVGGAALRAMTFHERAAALKAMAKHLMACKEK